MIIDCFTFFDEFDILDIRLHELDKWVDRFVLVECSQTFSGEKKPLWFEKSKNRVKPFLPKIIHLIAPPLKEKTDDFWQRIKNQLNYCQHALSDCAPNDLILIGDVDEIPRGQDFTATTGAYADMRVFIQKQYFFYLNLQRPGGWPGTILIPYSGLEGYFNGSLHEARLQRRKGHSIKQGGWHFTKIGNVDSVARKLRSSGHYNMPSIKKMWQDKDYLRDRMEVSRAIKGRELMVSSVEDHPKYFRDNIDEFKHLLTK